MHRWFATFFAVLLLSLALYAQDDGWTPLLQIHQDYLKLRDEGMKDAGHDFSISTVNARKKKLQYLTNRLQAVHPSKWAVERKVDWVLVHTELNDLDFHYRVVRPWSRDASFYLDFFARLPYTIVPVPADKLTDFRAQLHSISEVVSQAKHNLTEAGGDLTDIAIFHLERYDGVGQGEPLRNPPPEGALGWYADLLARVRKDQPDLVPDAEQALNAVRDYHDWLVTNRGHLNHPSAVGIDNYNWFLNHVRLMPYSADGLRVLGDTELSRARTFLKIEEMKNRDLPELLPAKTEKEYYASVQDAENLIRTFIEQNHLLTIPDYVGPQKTDAFWIERPGGKRHFWEEIQYRDPLVDHIHASIPGHRFDFALHEHDTRPVRSSYTDSGRIEGWGFYCEEMMLQAGILKDRPRARELFYIAQLARAARIPAELKIQQGEFSLSDAVQYMVKTVPFMDPNLARYDLEIYFRQPGYGMNYIAGKQQIEELLSQRAQKLGDKFQLGQFHDEFLAAGMIPVILTQWEMVGVDERTRREFELP
jgi:Bacterial protein of unknown function (DUF885)